MVQRGKRTGMAVNGFVSQEGLLPVLELLRQLDQQASCLKDQGCCLVDGTLILVAFLYSLTSFEVPEQM